ncbi:DUF4363 family protein [Romboutsia ilealis]|uniref:DUF4363 family protein n=1 Tax=Romboutsia faecis TaxID=2764597 RepID=A0ABR7JNY6_9FIRM|nr:DUF4363 family protein [Romboutsia faecis]MBC5996628.1 DUF4363 family protein [Romboutsia faecis]MRN24154.1 DUF4363 family protein [Romboutsia ilealis]
MKSVIGVIVWTILFTLLGIYINDEVYEFTDKYTSNINVIEQHIEDDNWSEASKELDSYSKNYYKEKEMWYKILDHTYFDDICLYINILDKSILTENKTQSFIEIEKIKMTFDNILESGKFDINHIF